MFPEPHPPPFDIAVLVRNVETCPKASVDQLSRSLEQYIEYLNTEYQDRQRQLKTRIDQLPGPEDSKIFSYCQKMTKFCDHAAMLKVKLCLSIIIPIIDYL